MERRKALSNISNVITRSQATNLAQLVTSKKRSIDAVHNSNCESALIGRRQKRLRSPIDAMVCDSEVQDKNLSLDPTTSPSSTPSILNLNSSPLSSSSRLLKPLSQSIVARNLLLSDADDDTYLENCIENTLLQREKFYAPKSNYMDWQPYLKPKMRAVLLEWLYQVCEEYKIQRETMSMAINFIDRFLSIVPQLARDRLQLLGVASLLVASKLDEIDALSVSTLAAVTDDTYTTEQVRQMETIIIQHLCWKLWPPTPYAFVKLYLQRLLQDRSLSLFPQDIFYYVMQHIDSIVLDISSLEFEPSVLAASSLYKHRCLNEATLVSMTGYSLSELAACLAWMDLFDPLPRDGFNMADAMMRSLSFHEYQIRTNGMEVYLKKAKEVKLGSPRDIKSAS